MSDVSFGRPARRFLHICYCCSDDTEAATFFVEGLKMKSTMRTTDEYSPGAILGMDHDVRSVANFVYDRRGPRISPAIEVQGWYDPAPVGEPSRDPFEVGIKALGFAVPSADEAIERLTAMGCTVVADGSSPFDTRHATLVDPRQVTLEVVEDATLGADDTQMHHLRVTVGNLDEALEFYDMLGFDVVERGHVTDSRFVGHRSDDGDGDGEVDGDFARLRLPDEPFELRLIQWNSPAGHGHHYAEPYHAGIYRAAVGVDDTRAAYERLSAGGAVFDRPPMEVELSGTPVPEMWITFISDPNGIPFEFVQRPRAAFK